MRRREQEGAVSLPASRADRAAFEGRAGATDIEPKKCITKEDHRYGMNVFRKLVLSALPARIDIRNRGCSGVRGIARDLPGGGVCRRSPFGVHFGALVCLLLLPGCGNRGGGAAGTRPLASVETPALTIPRPPVLLTGDSLRIRWMAEHYWDNLDWSDTTWIADTSVLETYFTPWAQLLAQMPESEAATLSGALFRKGDAHPDMQLRMMDAAEYFWHHPNSPFRNEALFVPVLEAVTEAPGIEDIYKVRPRAQLASALKNRPGTRAADFAYVMGGGGRGTLHGFRAEYTLLMFYNPGCPECTRIEEYIPQSEVFAPLIASGRLKVLAVYPDDDVMAWRSHLPQMPAGWTVGHAPVDKGGTAAYDLPGIPALYLLDRNKRVLVKDCPEDIIEAWLAQHADGK